jgi:hypothetical protein
MLGDAVLLWWPTKALELGVHFGGEHEVSGMTSMYLTHCGEAVGRFLCMLILS